MHNRIYTPQNTVHILQLVKPNIYYRIDEKSRIFKQTGWGFEQSETYEVCGHTQGIHENIFTYGNIRQQQYYFELANTDFTQKIIILLDNDSQVAYDFINSLANLDGILDIIVFEVYERIVAGKTSPGGSVRHEDEWQSIEYKYSDQEIPQKNKVEYFRKLAQDVDRRIQNKYREFYKCWCRDKMQVSQIAQQEKLF